MTILLYQGFVVFVFVFMPCTCMWPNNLLWGHWNVSTLWKFSKIFSIFRLDDMNNIMFYSCKRYHGPCKFANVTNAYHIMPLKVCVLPNWIGAEVMKVILCNFCYWYEPYMFHHQALRYTSFAYVKRNFEVWHQMK